AATNFATITEDNVTSNGDLVSTLIAGLTISDVDSVALQGIAVTATNSSTGTWQFSIDNGQNWSNVGAVSASSALLLRPTDKLRFVPDGKNGTTASVIFAAWDQTSGTAGQTGDASTP